MRDVSVTNARRIERFSCSCASYAESYDCEHARTFVRTMAEMRPHVIVALAPFDVQAYVSRRRERRWGRTWCEEALDSFGPRKEPA